ncbi:MAG TPA: YhcN/YlaJ family sporulation lipoprotein, partial [Bacillaceae bacterium]
NQHGGAQNDEGADKGNRDDNRMEVADDAADRIERLEEVDRASVIVSGKSAYVAVKLDNNENNKLTSDLEEKISGHARDTVKDIDNVYVSINPDFYDRMRGFREDIRNGRPVSGFFGEFRESVERVFPTAK